MPINLARSFNHIPVEIAKVSGARLLWRDKVQETNEMSDAQFVDNFACVVKNGFFNDGSRICANATQIMFAERYGGFGIGTNGGGARVVNTNNVQIKGVGANALAGDGALQSHSYGGLDIQGAVKEIIYSRLINKLSPVGAQKIDGLILLDQTSALHNGNSTPSVLMVRELVSRPAHFLPCVKFKVKPEHQLSIRSDYSRVLGIFKSIGRQALRSEFYALIQHFLDRSANQLSFFRIARFSHNALTPSNISMDGRVLDTALCSFIISGSNYGQVTSYYEESATPPLIAKELFFLINKFLSENSAEEHFLKLYEEKFYQYACVNMGFIFGLDRELSTKFSCTPEWRKVAHRYLSLLSMGSPTKNSTLPVVDNNDFINDILTSSLFSIINGREVNKSNKFLFEFTGDLRALISAMASALGLHKGRESEFNKTFAIQTIKRAVLSSYFFITYIGALVDSNYASGNIDKTEDIISDNQSIADWIFENLLSEEATIYSGEGVRVFYNCATNEYIYQNGQKSEERFKDIDLVRAIIDSEKERYIVYNFNFYPYIQRLLALASGDAQNSFNGVKNVFG